LKRQKIAILLLILLAFSLVVFLVWKPFLNGVVKRIFIAEVSRRLNAKMSLSELNVTLFPPKVELDGLELHIDQGPLKYVRVQSARVVPKMGLTALGRVAISRVEVTGPVLRFEVSKEAVPKKKKKGLLKIPALRDLIKVDIDQVKVEGAALTVIVPSENARFSIGSGNMNFKSESDVEIWEWTGDGTLRIGEKILALDRVQISAERTGQDVKLKQFSIHSSEIEATIRGKAYPEADLKYGARGPLNVLRSRLQAMGLIKEFDEISGLFVGKGSVVGPWDHLKTSDEWWIKNIGYQKFKIDEVYVKAKTDAGKAVSLTGEIKTGGSGVNFTLGGIAPGKSAPFLVESKKLSLARVLKQLSPGHEPDTFADIDVKAQGEISFSPFNVKGTYEIRSDQLDIVLPNDLPKFLPLQFRQIRSTGSISWRKEGVLVVEGGKLNAEGIEGDYTFEFPKGGKPIATWNARVLDAGGAFARDYPAHGKGIVKGGISHGQGSPEILLDIHLDQLSYAEYEPLPFKGQIVFLKTATDLRNFYLGNKNRKVRVDAHLPHQDQTEGVQIKGDWSEFDLSWMAEITARVYPVFGRIEAGVAAGSLDLSGSGHSSDVNGTVALSAREVTIAGHDFEKLDTLADFDRGQVTFQRAILSGDIGTAVVKGVVGKLGFRGLDVKLTKVPIGILELPSWLLKFASHTDGGFQLTGELENPDVQGNFRLFYLDKNNQWVERAVAQFQDRIADLGWSIQDKANTLEAHGRVNLKDGSGFDGQGRFSKFSLSWLLNEAASTLNADWNLKGSVASYGGLSGAVNIQDLSMAEGEWNLNLMRPVKATIQNGVFRLEDAELKGASTDLKIDCAVGNRGELTGLVAGRVSLGIVTLFLKDVTRADGLARVRVQLKGNVSNPQFTGNLQLEHGLLQFRNFPQSVEEISLKASLDQRRVFVDEIEGMIGGGSVVGQGEMTIGNSLHKTHVVLNGSADRVQFRFPTWLPSIFSGPVSLVGPLSNPLLRGDLTVHEATYRDVWDWKSKVLSFGRGGPRMRMSRSDEERIRFDLLFKSEKDQFFIRNNIATGKMRGAVRLTGSAQAMGLLGRVEVLQGQVTFLDNKFDIVSGSVAFESENSVKTNFDITARTRVRDTDIYLDIRTEEEEVRVFLNSQPPKEETNIVALLTLGVDTDELASVGASDQNLGSVAGAGALSSPIQSKLETGLKRARIVDTFQFVPYFSENTKTTGLKMTVGKQLFPKVRLLYSTDLFEIGAENVLKLEQGFNEHVSMQGSFSDNRNETTTSSDYGVGLDFEFKFEF
jgi:hypothetical protein